MKPFPLNEFGLALICLGGLAVIESSVTSISEVNVSIEQTKPVKPIIQITTDGVKSDTVYIYKKN